MMKKDTQVGVVLVAFLYIFVALVTAREGEYKIEGSIVLPVLSKAKYSNIRLYMTGNEGEVYEQVPNIKGKFAFHHIPSGSFLLEVFTNDLIFDAVKLDIKSGKVRARVANDTSIVIGYPLELKPVEKARYFQERVPFNFASYLKNPMMLMVGVTMILSFVMPKLMANLDPEALKEMQGQQNSNAPTPVQALPSWTPPLIENKKH